MIQDFRGGVGRRVRVSAGKRSRVGMKGEGEGRDQREIGKGSERDHGRGTGMRG